jgi:ribosomal protein S18 acetylase RimI-like enzyme
LLDAVSIRRLVPADLSAYKALRDTLLASDPESFTSDARDEAVKTPSSYQSRLGLDHPQGGHFVLGAWRANSLVGAIGCEREWRRKVQHIGKVIGMMVRRDERRAGVGRALLDACIAEARRADGLEMLTLTVTAGNLSAVHLYEVAGFTRYGTLARAIRLDGRFLDKHLMALTL